MQEIFVLGYENRVYFFFGSVLEYSFCHWPNQKEGLTPEDMFCIPVSVRNKSIVCYVGFLPEDNEITTV